MVRILTVNEVHCLTGWQRAALRPSSCHEIRSARLRLQDEEGARSLHPDCKSTQSLRRLYIGEDMNVPLLSRLLSILTAATLLALPAVAQTTTAAADASAQATGTKIGTII